MTNLHETFARQTEAFMDAARDGRVPEGLQTAAQEGIARSREAYATATVATQVAGKAFGDVAEVAGKGAMTLAETAAKAMSSNVEAAFEAANRVARAKTFPEAARLQVEFAQSQLDEVRRAEPRLLRAVDQDRPRYVRDDVGGDREVPRRHAQGRLIRRALLLL